MCPFNTRTTSIPDWWPTFSIKLSKRRLFAIRGRNEDPTRRSPSPSSSSSKRKVFKETSCKRKLSPKISQTFPLFDFNEKEREAKGFVYRYIYIYSWNQFQFSYPNILCQSSHGSYWNYKSLISVLHYRQSLSLFKFHFHVLIFSFSPQSLWKILTQVWLNSKLDQLSSRNSL